MVAIASMHFQPQDDMASAPTPVTIGAAVVDSGSEDVHCEVLVSLPRLPGAPSGASVAAEALLCEILSGSQLQVVSFAIGTATSDATADGGVEVTPSFFSNDSHDWAAAGHSVTVSPALASAEVQAPVTLSQGAELGATQHSVWRMPTTAGKLPVYVQRQFRLKAMGLLSFQLLIVLCIMLGVEQSDILSSFDDDAKPYMLVGCVLVVMATLMLVSAYKATYPANYLLLALLTVADSFAWSLGAELAETHLHIQIVTIMCVAMIFSTAFVWALTYRMRHHTMLLVCGGIFSGWVVASALQLALAPSFGGIGWAALEACQGWLL
mmetsp:Transcript_69553/g.226555  ORF Transcript_69553/g.226555 Transcript_69553/m.226555 type:complete len:323 (+) Transcript_69553:49-1017(+)